MKDILDFEIKKVEKHSELADRLLEFVGNFSWEEVKKHTLWMLHRHHSINSL